jgi:hypothetical protein
LATWRVLPKTASLQGGGEVAASPRVTGKDNVSRGAVAAPTQGGVGAAEEGMMEKRLGFRLIDLRSTRARPAASSPDVAGSAEEVLESLCGVETCDACGRALLVCEDTSPVLVDEQFIEVCPTCRGRALAGGLRPAA